MPSTISVGVTPRVCAIAAPASANTPTSTPAPSLIFMVSPRVSASCPAPRPSGLRVHPVDDILVLGIDERPFQLHGRCQLFVLRGQDLLDEAELLDGLDPGQLLVHPLDLARDQVLHLLRAAERGEVGERDIL